MTGSDELRLSLPTIGCAPDAWLIENRLKETVGVLSSKIDCQEKRGVIRYDEKQVLPQDIITVVNATGFKAEPIKSDNTTMPAYELQNLPVSCGLLPDELKEREATTLSDFAHATQGYLEMTDGFAFKVEPSDSVLRLLSEFIIAESQCCPFLQFRLIALQGRHEVCFEIRGPQEAKSLLRKVLPASAFANAVK